MQSHPLNYFDKIFVINLPSRPDRRSELLQEFSAIGFAPSTVRWFDAVKPDDRGPFESIGVRGCFLSHLGILRQVEKEGAERLLILEDDASFAPGFANRFSHIVDVLAREDWDLFYGGGRLDTPVLPSATGLMRVEPQDGIGCSHFIAIKGSKVADLRAYFEAQLGRPDGDPHGGPMPVDGSYSWARRDLNLTTLIASPDACFQRSSRSDITTQWWDDVYGLRQAAALYRRLKTRTQRAVSHGGMS
ncbi:glycosyltransferase family 25 protein [Rhizobium sp. S152]|uniref:glycosyltransferase family 25 protein n=1 Tax=Rhizobium sp. S152 TaxID=3055038 RepID=UPI0025A966D2|nr:glycosyltransferase family 25 protein [Rhizobium sp. S152]MDM9626933.1 glycosyltransferase family 25 protein [Rhizobium sp. S152]